MPLTMADILPLVDADRPEPMTAVIYREHPHATKRLWRG
jgi:hypothetical protein